MKDKLDEYIDGVENLPPSPSLMVELIKQLEKPDRDIDQLISLMSHDPSLTAEVLKRCNSAYFGNDKPATDIFEATFRLGFYEVYRVSTGLFASRAMRHPGAERGLELDALWEHSALTAVSAGFLAREFQENEAIAFTAGLLHDVGKIVLACAEGVTYAEVTKAAVARSSLSAAEAEFFGFHHAEIGGRLLARWGLPDNIVSPVQSHHCPNTAASFERLASILHTADYMAHCLVDGSIQGAHDGLSGDFSLTLLQIDPQTMPEMLEKVQQDAKRVKELFHARSDKKNSNSRLN